MSRRPVDITAQNGKATSKSFIAEERELTAILDGLRSANAGDFAVRLQVRKKNGRKEPLVAEIARELNTLIGMNQALADEIVRVERIIGREGRMTERASLARSAGGWGSSVRALNALIGDLVRPTTEVARVLSAVAEGDLTQKMALEIEGQPVKGEFLRIGMTVNRMVDQLNGFAAEVTRVAEEVGVEGKLGGQARVPGVGGVWKDLTNNVNLMATNLTTQVRGIVKVVTAVANGDLSQTLVVDAKGEVAALAETINSMTQTLGTFAAQVSTVAREVGIEGKLGGQAKVPGAMGTWRQLTDNVNQLAGNLTTQVRAISEVATAVTKGDLTRSIDVEAEGEVAALKDNINQMIVNLKETTQKNAEQDWLKTNLAKFSGMMQGQKSLETVSRMIMSELTPLVGAHHGAFFMMELEANVKTLKLVSSYAYRERKSVSNRFRLGESLVGQCALEKKPILLTRVPTDYIQISSGLGEAPPLNIVVLPVLFEGEVKGVIELASFHPFSAIHQLFLDQLMDSIGVVLNMISANMRTEQLLLQSQSLTEELKSQSQELKLQQEELKRTNAALAKQALELEEKAKLLEIQNQKVEIKNREVEQGRVSLEEKAAQLALISKYKSEFLANMSHELRTPLNSLLILAKLLAENREGNLTEKQVEYAETIFSSGGDLLALINEILDLSKVEAGKMQVEPRDVPLIEIQAFAERDFRPTAEEKKLDYVVRLDPRTPQTINTDLQRLEQVLKNLLANAFKFTDAGRVRLDISIADKRRVQFTHPRLVDSQIVIAFAVSDTGIGIPKEKQRIIFEAFQQADGTTSRKYGGTGLGLSISREIARLLGGEIQVESEPGRGSTFTFYLPDAYAPSQEGLAPDKDIARALDVSTPVLPAPEPVREDKKIADDQDQLRPGDHVVLIIEDDPRFAEIMVGVAREGGFKAVVAPRGDIGLAMANLLVPDAITLDIRLPIVDGWFVLDRLKRNPRTQHIPVHVISVEEKTRRSSVMGAVTYLEKPVSREALQGAFAHMKDFISRSVRRLLIVEDDSATRFGIRAFLGDGDDVELTSVSTTEAALEALDASRYDCLIVDLMLPGVDGFKLIEELRADPTHKDLPIIVYTSRDLTTSDENRLKKDVVSIILKADPNSSDRLVADSARFLHRVRDNLSEGTQAALARVTPGYGEVAGRRVLIVDDDIRNAFAMTSTLEGHGIVVRHADNGRAGIETLNRDPNFDAILMDVMMPEMDGYETIRSIRNDARFSAIPIIAVTAKALKEDRNKCFDAGASDYLPKPVDPEKLIELMRMWTKTS